MQIAGLNVSELAELAGLLIVVGALAGFLAGLFGIGGGAVLVPVFYECFRLAGVPLEVRMPLCIGTSLAIACSSRCSVPTIASVSAAVRTVSVTRSIVVPRVVCDSGVNT